MNILKQIHKRFKLYINMLILLILTLVDIHTLFVLIFHNYLPLLYVLGGSTFAIIKGMIFYIPFKNTFSLIDIIIGITMLFLLIGELFSFIYLSIFIFLSYMILMSLSVFIK